MRWFPLVSIFACFSVVAVLLVRGASPKSDETTFLPISPEEWVLTFSDDFEGNQLDLQKWTPRDPWEVVRNVELQAYVPDAIQVTDGTLTIDCSESPAFYDGKERAYSSGMMSTTGKFAQTYGLFEIRCKVPHGRGLWPAFWLLPDPPAWPPEIDVFEILGHETDRVYLTNHWPHPDRPKDDSESCSGEFRGPDFAEGFHTFSVEWAPDLIIWRVDGVERHCSTTEVPDQPMFMLANLAVGGWAGDPGSTTVFPAQLEVDYVKVWRRKNY